MEKKQFQTESKKLLDMMVNSIYTHKEIFLRELISNASDALDKLYFRSLTDDSVARDRSEYEIRISTDPEERTLSVSDNGCGMGREELETNLGTIAKSGSFDFKAANKGEKNATEVDVIGQFGVGFYSAFMVADRITVESLAFGESQAWRWESSGADGYTVEPCEKNTPGTEVTLYLKPDTEDEKYSDYLTTYKIRELVRKYSDYIRYPIRMKVEESVPKEDNKEEYEKVLKDETLNSMIPLWKKAPVEISDEEYNRFYQDKFFDFEAPLKTIHIRAEGGATYEALLFIPAHAPYNYYTKEYEKGLQLYSSGVMIMEKCADLIPDHFGFVRGLVDSADLSLNISREMLQHDRQLKVIARAIAKKIRNELEKMRDGDRTKYDTFFDAFGLQLKYGLYADYGAHKEDLQDLVMFHSAASEKGKYKTLKEYLAAMPEAQKDIYYACGETVDQIAMLPSVEGVRSRGYDVLYLTDDVDEFALKMLGEYEGKKFVNVCTENLDIATEEEKEALKEKNEELKPLLEAMKKALDNEVKDVRLTNTLKGHAVNLVSEGDLSVEMEKVLGKMPGGATGYAKASLILELNANHPVVEKLHAMLQQDPEKVETDTKILYAQARLIAGLSLENPSQVCDWICSLI